MAGEQFQVHPAALTALAGKFESESQDLASQTNKFASDAAHVGEAFGLLGACDGAMSQYEKLLNGTVKALGQLAQVLFSDGQGLRINAESYSAAEQDMHQGMQAMTSGM